MQPRYSSPYTLAISHIRSSERIGPIDYVFHIFSTGLEGAKILGLENDKQNACMTHIGQVCNNQQHRKFIWHISVSLYVDSLIHKLSSVHKSHIATTGPHYRLHVHRYLFIFIIIHCKHDHHGLTFSYHCGATIPLWSCVTGRCPSCVHLSTSGILLNFGPCPRRFGLISYVNN
jgi:hypothetical protein